MRVLKWEQKRSLSKFFSHTQGAGLYSPIFIATEHPKGHTNLNLYHDLSCVISMRCFVGRKVNYNCSEDDVMQKWEEDDPR